MEIRAEHVVAVAAKTALEESGRAASLIFVPAAENVMDETCKIA